MSKHPIIFLIALVFFCCKTENKSETFNFFSEEIPGNIPLEFKPEIIPDDKIIHKGMFSPDLKDYYYTLSDKNFKTFDVFKIEGINGSWSKPKVAFFNSKYNEHGMSFSPSGNSLYFSSTRPTNVEGVSLTWHIWKSEKINGEWQEPVFVDIPNLRGKLVSHPTVTDSGTIYFHSSNLDYNEMNLYRSKLVNGKYGIAKKVVIPLIPDIGKCTPYISPDEKYLVFASIEKHLNLYISFNDGKGNWINTKKLNSTINNSGQGNPFVTPDNKFLFFTTGDYLKKKWKVKWISIESELKTP